MNIGGTIKDLRKKKNLSQIKLADLSGISQTSLSQIENNITNPSSSTVKKICEVLELPEQLIYLFSLENQDIPEEKAILYEKLYPIIKEMMLSIFDDKK